MSAPAMTSEPTPVGTGRAVAVCAGLGALAALAYLLLPTQAYSGDGLRWYPDIASLKPAELSGTNHLLYAPLARAYFSLMVALGAAPGYALAQSMNALFAGLGIASVAYITRSFARAWAPAFGAVALMGLSRAFSVHAVDMTEPMPGAALALLGIAVATARVRPAPARDSRRGRWMAVLAGTLIGAGAAIYQSMLLAVGLAALLLLLDPGLGRPLRARMLDAGLCVLACGLAASALYVAAFLSFGVADSVAEAVRLSLISENDLTQGIYAELSPRRLAVLAFGLGDALYGMRGLSPNDAEVLRYGVTTPLMLALGVVGFCWTMAATVVAARAASRGRTDARVLIAFAVALIPLLLMPLYFGARYTKLWLLPAAVLAVGLAIAVDQLRSQAPGKLSRIASAAFWGGLVLPVAVHGAAVNLIPDHVTPNPGLVDALAVRAYVGPRDLLVSDWGGLAYDPTFASPTLSLYSEALRVNRSGDALMARMADHVAAARARGGSVYFYGLLDFSEREWGPFWFDRLNAPYSLVEAYRNASKPVIPLSARTPTGGQQHLWRLEP